MMKTYPRVSDSELSQNVLRHVVLCDGIHYEERISLRPFRWPVLMTLVPVHFFAFSQHDNDVGIVFPQHAPKIVDSFWKWSLSGDVCTSIAVSITKTSINEISSFNPTIRVSTSGNSGISILEPKIGILA